MFSIDHNLNLAITWGDCGSIRLTAKNGEEFPAGSVLRLTVYDDRDPGEVYLTKDVTVEETTSTVVIDLLPEDTRFPNRSSVELHYRYDITLNPDTAPQTIVGYERHRGERDFTVLPKGGA